jgi:nicotinamidase-related amidase
MPVARKPETLSAIAGLSTRPGRPEGSVLLVIDPQLEYTVGRLPLAGVAAAVEEGARLLSFARARGMPVFHAVHHARAGAPVFDPRGPHVGFIPALAPLEGESVIVKGLPNAFAGTALAAAITATGRREIVIAGFATHMCVSATARSALDHGLRSIVVANATATRDLPDPLGDGTVTAAAVHAATLAALADRFSVVVRDTDALSSPDAHPVCWPSTLPLQ